MIDYCECCDAEGVQLFSYFGEWLCADCCDDQPDEDLPDDEE